MANDGYHGSKSTVRIADSLSIETVSSKFCDKPTNLTSRTSKPSQASDKSDSSPDQEAIPHPGDFIGYVPWICRQFNVHATVIRVMNGERLSDKMNSLDNKVFAFEDDDRDTTTKQLDVPRIELRIIAHINKRLRLSEIILDKNDTVPAFVIGIIAAVLQHHVQCNKITINKGLNADGVKEIKDMLDTVTIKELCFDGMPAPNYHILFDNMTSLQHLSMARCKINDKYMKVIAERLIYPATASKSLSVLNLSSNHITDVGLKYLANALRSNRQLHYINIADNYFTDEGVVEILEPLMEFKLTTTEVKMYKPSVASKGDKSPKQKEKSSKIIRKKIKIKPTSKNTKATSSNSPRSPDYPAPFDPSNVISKDGSIYSIGNNSLCYINIAYNILTNYTVKKILHVLKYQMSWTQGGLKMVNIEGCRFIHSSPDLEEINTMLKNNLSVVKSKSKARVRLLQL